MCISRKLNEKIYIGENITIVVVDVDRGKVKLGIEAPRETRILRAELVGQAVKKPAPAA